MAAVTLLSFSRRFTPPLPGYHTRRMPLEQHHLWSPLSSFWGLQCLPKKPVKPLSQVSSIFIPVYLIITKDQSSMFVASKSFQPIGNCFPSLQNLESQNPYRSNYFVGRVQAHDLAPGRQKTPSFGGENKQREGASMLWRDQCSLQGWQGGAQGSCAGVPSIQSRMLYMQQER